MRSVCFLVCAYKSNRILIGLCTQGVIPHFYAIPQLVVDLFLREGNILEKEQGIGVYFRCELEMNNYLALFHLLRDGTGDGFSLIRGAVGIVAYKIVVGGIVADDVVQLTFIRLVCAFQAVICDVEVGVMGKGIIVVPGDI